MSSTAVHAMLVYLAINFIKLQYEDKNLEDAIISVAAGSMSCEQLGEWIRVHIVPFNS